MRFWYQLSDDKAPIILPEVIRILGSIGQGHGLSLADSHPEDWARFRLRWHDSMTQGNSLQPRKLGKSNRKLRVPAHVPGLLRIVECQYAAAKGDWEEAIKNCEETLPRIPKKYQPLFQNLLDGYRKKEIYAGTEQEVRMYLEVAGGTQFFRHFAHRLKHRLGKIYRQDPDF